MTSWIEPSGLLALVERIPVRGEEPARDVIMRSPSELIPVTDATLSPLDIGTYEVRLKRWRQGDGPRLAGIEGFVSVLRTLDEPARSVTVSGGVTTYVYLLDSEMTRAIAAVAIDPPSAKDMPCD